MAPVQCPKCGKEVKNELALKIHTGIKHGGKAGRKPGRPRKAGRGARIGKFRCGLCGRTFRMAMHLARHASVAHGKVRKARARGGRRAGPSAAAAVRAGAPDVRTMAVDQLLKFKKAVDARLGDILRQMRLAKVRL